MSLEKLFQQIIESEQTSESRREGITQAKKKISTCEMEIRAMTESCSSMRCKVKILSSRLQDEQAERLVLQEQSRVLKNKKAEIKKSIESLQGVLNDSRLQFHDKQSDYCKRVVSFCSDYDLTSDRCKRTKGEMKQDKGELEQKKRQLMNELEDLNSKEERISEILAQRVCSQADISELRSLIEMEDKKSSEMRREFHEIAQKVYLFISVESSIISNSVFHST